MKFSTLIALVSLGFASAKTSSDFTFSTQEANQLPKGLRRHRRTKAEMKTKLVPKAAANGPTEEDRKFWDRVLGTQMSIPAPSPTDAPVVETAAPTPCPVIIDVDCVSVDGSESCTDIEAPASGTGDDCIKEVEFSYTVTNVGNEVERIYSLEITRGGETTDITSTFSITDIAPGASALIVQNAQIDVCQGGDSAFDTEAGFVTGPPCDVEVVIACESEAGDECRQLPQAGSPEECLIDITYTYTVTNIGDVDANIVLFTRTRNGEFVNLIGELDGTFLAVSQDTAVEETEEIDRCIQQSFATNTIVAQVPNADLLCEDVGFYP